MDADPQGDLAKSPGWKDPDALETTLVARLNAIIEDMPLDPREDILSPVLLALVDAGG